MLDESGHPTALAWQYARDGWAVAQWSGPRPAQLREIAARVRYRSNLRLAFPFRLAGIPATWKVTGAGSQVEGGKLRGDVLYLGPRHDPGGLRRGAGGGTRAGAAEQLQRPGRASACGPGLAVVGRPRLGRL